MAGVDVLRGRLVAPTGWFAATPGWVLLPQLFLAAGWLRVAVENTTTAGWWSGEAVRAFLATDTGNAVAFYEPFLTRVVDPLAAGVAAVVVTVEAVVAASLALNRRPVAALLAGAFLNVQFMLAGAVNPSAFYLVIAMVILLWRFDERSAGAHRRTLARRLAVGAAVAATGLVPFIRTLAPAEVIMDPAIVLAFLGVLFAAAVWWAGGHSGSAPDG